MPDRKKILLDSGHEGFLFTPDEKSVSGQCVIIFHERYGLVKHTLDLAEKLVKSGYVVLAPDLFSLWDGDKEALKRGDVRATVSDEDCVQQTDLWVSYLRTNVLSTDRGKIALMGVCQSGRYPIVVASEREDLSACVVFYGATQERDWDTNEMQPRSMPELLADISTPSLFVFAEKDHTISIDNVLRLRQKLEELDNSYRMKIVPDVPHGFLNDTMPGRYRAEETSHSWSLLLKFLEDVFENDWPQDRVVWDFRSDKARDYDFTKNVRLE